MNILKMIGIIMLVVNLTFPLYSFAQSPTDQEIVEAIETQIALDDFISDLDVNVSCHNGVVYLDGTAGKAETNKLIDIAQSTPGVSKVDASGLSIEEQ